MPRTWGGGQIWGGPQTWGDDDLISTADITYPDSWPSVRIEAAWDNGARTDPTDDSQWSSIAEDCYGFNTTRGRTNELDAFPAGTASLNIDNTATDTGRPYDVDNPDSPYVGKLTYNRQLRVIARWNSIDYPVWRGYSEQWGPVDSDLGHDYADLTVQATDAFKLLTNRTINTPRPFTIGDPVLGVIGDPRNRLPGIPKLAVQKSGDRLAFCLTVMDWPTTLQRVDPGASLVLADTPTDKALAYFQRLETSEYGRFFVGADGALEYHQRRGISRAIQCVCSDNQDDIDGGALPYVEPTNFDPGGRSTLKNIVTRGNGIKTLSRRDLASIGEFDEVEDSKTDLLTVDPGELDDQCSDILSRQSTPHPRYLSITFAPEQNPDLIWPQILGRQIGERIQINRTPDTTSIPGYYAIEGIQHTVSTAPFSWRTTFNLSWSPPEPGYFTVGVSTIGGSDVIPY